MLQHVAHVRQYRFEARHPRIELDAREPGVIGVLVGGRLALGAADADDGGDDRRDVGHIGVFEAVHVRLDLALRRDERLQQLLGHAIPAAARPAPASRSTSVAPFSSSCQPHANMSASAPG